MMIFWISEPLWQVQADSLKMEYKNPKKAKKGGTLRVGYINNDAFKGIFSPEIADDGPTLELAQFGMVSLFKIDPNNEFKHGAWLILLLTVRLRLLQSRSPSAPNGRMDT